MTSDTYHKDHWAEIEEERLARYEEMLVWRPEQGPLLAPARIEPGQTVLDFGCALGSWTLELARRVGPGGHVHGVDLNAEFIARARARAEAEGLAGRLTFHHVTDERVPLADASIDRVICKNVLEYVPDVDRVLAELHRLQRPGGLTHTIDSDWGFVIVEPWPPETVTEFFRAAAAAFKQPYIGRALPAALRRAGYHDLQVTVLAAADTEGRILPMLLNMEHYIRRFGSMPEPRLSTLMGQARAAMAAGEFLGILPQFLVTGVA